MRVGRAAVLLFAGVLAAIGVLNIVYRDFALEYQPVPDWVSHRSILAIASGVFLIVCALGLVRGSKALAATFAALYLVVWVVMLQGPLVLAAPISVGAWLGFFWMLAILGAALIVMASVSDEPPSVIVFGRFLFGLMCIVFGLSHIAHGDGWSQMVPNWLQAYPYVVGSAQLAAGLAILSGRLARLGATLEAVMTSSFVALVQGPIVVHAPKDRLQWTILVFAFALAGSAWVVVASLRDRPWLKANAA